MIVASAAETLDVLLEARITWVVSMADAGGLAVGFHALHMCASEVYRVVDGCGSFGRALEHSSSAMFPAPYGRVEVYEVGHPEPYTLHQCFPSLRTAYNHGAVYPRWAMDRLLSEARLGLADDEPLRLPGIDVDPKSVAIALDVQFRQRNPSLDLGPNVSYAQVECLGTRDGQSVREVFLAPDRMSEGAGGAAAVAADLVAHGQTRGGAGVFAPEVAFSPTEYMAAMTDANVSVVSIGTGD